MDKPQPFEEGICFICKLEIREDPTALCHYECAVAYAEVLEERKRNKKEKYPWV